jgi:hypothetical protein
MDTIELRIMVTEEMVRELLWQALAPGTLVMIGTLNDAIAQQAAMRGVVLDSYRLTGISVTVDNDVIHAELAYMAMRSEADRRV